MMNHYPPKWDDKCVKLFVVRVCTLSGHRKSKKYLKFLKKKVKNFVAFRKKQNFERKTFSSVVIQMSTYRPIFTDHHHITSNDPRLLLLPLTSFKPKKKKKTAETLCYALL